MATAIPIPTGPRSIGSSPQWPSHGDDEEVENATVRGKRSRVTLACQRCKLRKQKCDGNAPCEKCRTTGSQCEYVIPRKPMPFGQKKYIQALEHRVAELETILATNGMTELGSDHWRSTMNPTTPRSPDRAATQTTPTSKSPTQTDPSESDLDDAVLDWQDSVDTVSSVLRSLSLDVNGSGYVGASSHIAFGRLFSFVNGSNGRDKRHSISAKQKDGVNHRSVPEDVIDFGEMSDMVADRLFAGYQKHVATRWPVIHSVWAFDLHKRRQRITDLFETMMLHLIYATAGRFIESTGESNSKFFAIRHYNCAVRCLDTVLGFNDIRSVQALMLLAVYCLRDPVGAGAWIYSRTALLIAIDHGMHRQTKALSVLSMDSQLRKRLFWACYAFDRQISIPMGRPFGISDRDIDIDLPLDINEDSTDTQLANLDSVLASRSTSSTLTSFLMVVQLRRIESDIQQTIYRVDKSSAPADLVVDAFLARLEAWKASIPPDTHCIKDAGNAPFDGYDYYMVFFYKCQRLLLYPQISKAKVAPRFLKACARACAGVCGAYKRLHQSLAVGYSLMALQTVFMAGLTLVYCLWISPEEIFDSTTSNGIHDCSIVLFVIADRVPAARRYRNAFEVIRQRVIDHISTMGPAERRSRATVPGLTAELAASASYPFDATMEKAGDRHLDVDEGSLDQMSHILTAMAGEQFPGQPYRTAEEMFMMHQPLGVDDPLYNGNGGCQPSGDIQFPDAFKIMPSSYGDDFPNSGGTWDFI